MGRERGSATIMAITAMLVLAAASSSYVYVANRNVNIATEYNDGLQAQYSAEAAVRAYYVAGQESMKASNGYQVGENSALEDWKNLVQPIPISLTLPGTMGSARMRVTTASTSYNVEALATVRRATRLAYNSGIDLLNNTALEDTYTPTTMKQLITTGKEHNAGTTKKWTYSADGTVSYSPEFNTVDAWKNVTSQVLFDDVLGLDTFTATNNLQLVFRINDYVKLVKVPGTGAGSGYGIYYLAKKKANGDPTDDGNPTAYVIQFDPGLNPTFDAPDSDGNNVWGATRTDTVTSWPYGAFLVKKVKVGTEVWDEGGTYQVHSAFQKNNELVQRYYNESGIKQTVNLSDSSTWALRPVSAIPGTTKPTVNQVPTAFGPDLTGKYNGRPPDLRIAYTLGNIAEGNPWQPDTYYPEGAKVAVGIWVEDALNKREVWVATKAGKSGSSRPFGNSLPAVGTVVGDGTVKWTAQLAPTPEQVAKFILTNSPLSIAKASMAEVNFRVDSVNGTTPQSEPFSIPFKMLLGGKNKITFELWADNLGNRVHVIRVNDVLMLGFNDRAGKNNDFIPANWELDPSANPRGTGIRIWNAAAEFYTSENYGQTLSSKTKSNYGTWGK